MHVLVTRPAADAAEFEARLRALGHSVLLDPLVTIETTVPANLDPRAARVLAATSRNALRALEGHPALPRLRSLPVFTVGPGTAELARSLGFADVRAGTATAADLVAPLAAAGLPVLHLRGEKTAFDLAGALTAACVAVIEVVVYRQVPSTHLRPETIAAMKDGSLDMVVLMSPLTAATWLTLVSQAGCDDAAGRLRYACLSAGIAATVAARGAETQVAGRPNAEEMLALVAAMAAQSGAKRSGT